MKATILVDCYTFWNSI